MRFAPGTSFRADQTCSIASAQAAPSPPPSRSAKLATEGAAMHVPTSSAFKQNAHSAIRNAGLQKALARSGPSFVARRTAAVAALPEFEQLRDAARDIKNHTLAHLDFYL